MNEDFYEEDICFICPYCGAKIHINHEIFSNYAMDDEEEVYCEDCDHTFIAFREVDVCYGSRKLNNNGKDQH